ncbi:cell division topological specificity factor MinE [Desulfobotulus sp.]|jgi:cell division topological specificity factor|uniref:cell division topological specificity factor MinE n=1 Tax=Desulfobotulus sp. TaxID=1940337 RepID=UPI002A36F31B|nr:cell division topological specificity factor MinE [Desulfobotulus sp.]MDY0163993.1 cell division topological specificity factor MinE [Desulfobotulus sp.]
MLNNLFSRMFKEKEAPPGEVAKKRLQFALIYDKLEVSDEMLENLQNDIVDVLSRYFEIDKASLRLDITRQEDLSALVLNTPIIAAKKRGHEKK